MDKIIRCDLFDTIFQGDPFDKNFQRTPLYIVDEGKAFYTKSGVINMRWMSYFGFSLKKSQRSQFYLCSGFIAGYKSIVLQVLNLFLNFSKDHLIQYFHDQAVFNILYFSNAFVNNHITVNVEPSVLKIRHRMSKRGYNDTLGFVTILRSATIFAQIIHQYYKSNNFMLSLQRACPNTLIA